MGMVTAFVRYGLAAVDALQRQGVAGMSFTEVLGRSGAARGAIYHHFPGGKTQLVAEAAERNGADVRAQLATLPTHSPTEVVEAFFAAVRPVLARSTTGAGCAVAAVTVGAGAGEEKLREVAAAEFGSWIQALAGQLAAAGMIDSEAHDLAATLIALLEGAHVLCRATATLDPFDSAVRTVRRALLAD